MQARKQVEAKARIPSTALSGSARSNSSRVTATRVTARVTPAAARVSTTKAATATRATASSKSKAATKAVSKTVTKAAAIAKASEKPVAAAKAAAKPSAPAKVAPPKAISKAAPAKPIAKQAPQASKELVSKELTAPKETLLVAKEPTLLKEAPVVAKETHEFKIGDKAVHPAGGVAEVVSIEEKDIAGNRQRFYVLRLLDTGHKILVPVTTAGNCGLRRPISDKEIKEIFRILKVTDVQIDNQTWNRRYRGFMDKIKTGSVFEVAEVLRDLSRLKSCKALSFGERQMLEKARRLVVKEIAVAKAKSEDKIQSEIDAIFSVS
jgi:CarD family transcriptional regulator